MLAMDVNDDDGCLTPRVAWTTIASKLGSYRGGCCSQNMCTPLPTWIEYIRKIRSHGI